MNSPYTAVQYYPEFPFRRMRDPSSRFLSNMSQSSQASDHSGPDLISQLFDMLDQSAVHSVQPIELNFSETPTQKSPGNTIQISMDCITMHQPTEAVSELSNATLLSPPGGICSLELVINGSTPTQHLLHHGERRGALTGTSTAGATSKIRLCAVALCQPPCPGY
ncbi:unnamed protein product [Knipowitschia caucasica]